MEYIKYPVINAPTAQGQVDQLKEFLIDFINLYNFMIAETERKLAELRGSNNGNV